MSQEWKLVPVEPTAEMLKVEVSPALCLGLPGNPRVGQWRLGMYRAMLAAAPVPPAGGPALPQRGVITGPITLKSGVTLDGIAAKVVWDAACNAWEPHVTRLQAEVERHEQELDSWANYDTKQLKVIHGLNDQVAALQSELTKARELNAKAFVLLNQFMPNAHKCFGIDFMLLNEAMIGLAQKSAPAQPSCEFCGKHAGEACDMNYPHPRSAPAAKYDCCANCMRPKAEHNGSACPAPYTTVWNQWDYNFAPDAKGEGYE